MRIEWMETKYEGNLVTHLVLPFAISRQIGEFCLVLLNDLEGKNKNKETLT